MNARVRFCPRCKNGFDVIRGRSMDLDGFEFLLCWDCGAELDDWLDLEQEEML